MGGYKTIHPEEVRTYIPFIYCRPGFVYCLKWPHSGFVKYLFICFKPSWPSNHLCFKILSSFIDIVVCWVNPIVLLFVHYPCNIRARIYQIHHLGFHNLII